MIPVAVVGCGAIAYEHLAFLSSDPRIDLVAVCDRSPVTARYTAARFGARQSFTDAAEMLVRARPAVVHVLTPPASHVALALDVLGAGAHAVVEKPIALSRADAQLVLDAAARAGRTVIESQNLRFNDEVRAIERLRRDGSLGEVVSVEIAYNLDITDGKFAREFGNPTRGLPGGAVHDFLPHLAYLALHFFDYGPIDRVASFWANRAGSPHVGFDEMVAVVAIGDATSTIRFHSQAQPPAIELVVRGSRARAETNLFHPYLRVETARRPAAVSGQINHMVNAARIARAAAGNLRERIMQKTVYHGLLLMLDDFYTSIEIGRAPSIAPAHILRSAELIDNLVSGVSP